MPGTVTASNVRFIFTLARDVRDVMTDRERPYRKERSGQWGGLIRHFSGRVTWTAMRESAAELRARLGPMSDDAALEAMKSRLVSIAAPTPSRATRRQGALRRSLRRAALDAPPPGE